MKHEVVPVLLIKDEEYWLPYVLESLAQIPWDKYVIYDINSQDKTRIIIDWWLRKHPDFNVLYKPLPMCDPKIQGCFRNSMIAEADSDIYFIVDGDEVYTEEDLVDIKNAAWTLNKAHDHFPSMKYGVVSRTEFDKDLRQCYAERRTHHRLYHRTAYWDGTHPGEEAHYAQKQGSEQHYPDITCYHFHNAERSSFGDAGVPGRAKRKSQRTYHPGDILEDIGLLDEVPILRKQIASWPVAPALKRLQEKYDAASV